MNIPFLLFLQVFCNNQWMQSRGAFVCQQAEPSIVRVKVKIPLTKGQFSARDCDGEITEDGNVDDFNTETVKEGVLWWARKRVIYSRTPEFQFKRGLQHNNCAVALGLAAEKAGVQQALIVVNTGKVNPLHIRYTCGQKNYSTLEASPYSNGPGTGACIAFSDAEFKSRVYVEEQFGILNIVSSSCLVAKKIVYGKGRIEPEIDDQGRKYLTFNHRLKYGACPTTFELKDGMLPAKSANILMIGNDRQGTGLDTPTLIKLSEGSYKVIKPLTSTMVFVELYKNQDFVWRSDVKELDFDFSWDKSKPALACVSAYSSANAMEGSCYELPSMKEVPYTFN